MISLAGLVTALTAAAAIVIAAPTTNNPTDGILEARQSSPPPPVGVHDGYFYEFWSDLGGNPVSANYSLSPGGGFGVEWDTFPGLTFTFGKGWSGANHNYHKSIEYEANLTLEEGGALFGVHGFALNPLVEYWIADNYSPVFENWVAMLPRQDKGEVTTSSGVYRLYLEVRTGFGYPQGVFRLYWAVRQTKRSSGIINTGEIFSAWASQDMGLNRHEQMLLSVEGWIESRGSAQVEMLGPPGGN
ncbi:concanavalin A-like lectin/glucanase [Sodiomyces alkalinus F11]|uniref:endo-1,4-beta-xylanase n=1 Tax=Sodiomyces alkalinus (strain CBS 110278 / VKM F-3762 / F11) TaxID=1314773 RepID=A0A3N2Q862_SODAK|nr:concanavalin A-like lectin/glucanase [Sodiomyces alkalinus F11]ROT42877.1 concanavalin A-like lectin/glucanase [Sodiomyces alkalinus F11]